MRATSFCPHCNVRLTYEAGAQLVACPACGHSFDPMASQRTACLTCGAMLEHPPTALYIICPKCMQMMNPRLARPPFLAGLASASAPSTSSSSSAAAAATAATVDAGHDSNGPIVPVP